MKLFGYLSIMKKIIIILAVAIASGFSAVAQTNSAIKTELQAIVKKVQAKISSGKDTETDLKDELKSFDDLVASAKDAPPDELAHVVFMKAELYLQVLKNFDKGTELIKQIKANYPDSKYGKDADKILASIEKQAAAKKIQDGLAPGAAFPDFAETDLDGKALSVGALKGKVVLVDFWATWCGPCKAELPNVIATYKKHHAAGFEIIGISLDSDREKLDSFLKKQDGMTWPQYFDGKGWSNKLAGKYGVESIPFAVLVGPDGNVIGKDLRGEELENAVADALAKK